MKKQRNEEVFYPLDNSAIFMAAIASASGPFVFRFYCEVDEPVLIPALQDAVDALFPRFPFFFVRLRMGLFWHYLEPVSKPPQVEREIPYPCASMPGGHDRPLVRIFAYGRRISVEFHHVITDGTGAVTFIKALVVEYLRRKERYTSGLDLFVDPVVLQDIKVPENPPEEGEAEDGYNKYFRPSNTSPNAPIASQLRDPTLAKTPLRLI
ncbi:MAG: hypothetical protein SNJ56_07015, partial [Termitinemataceae bacterium]